MYASVPRSGQIPREERTARSPGRGGEGGSDEETVAVLSPLL